MISAGASLKNARMIFAAFFYEAPAEIMQIYTTVVTLTTIQA